MVKSKKNKPNKKNKSSKKNKKSKTQRGGDFITARSSKPADYYAFVNKKTWKIRFFKIGDCPINKDTWNPTIKINSVFIETYNESKMISKTQIKFNNGVGTSMRKWNLVADLSYLFSIKHLPEMDLKRAFL